MSQGAAPSEGYAIQSPPPPCDIPSHCCFFTGPWTVTHSSLRTLRRFRCVLSAAAAGAPAGVVSAFAEPRRWCAGAVLDVAVCAACASVAPSSCRTVQILKFRGILIFVLGVLN